jgi:glutamate formiminotransferase/formiminotetrahydrofolate cyclodeaminase
MDLIECIPNISEGQNLNFLDRLSTIISNSEGVELKNRDIGKSVHRTVFTFIGKEDDVLNVVYKIYEASVHFILFPLRVDVEFGNFCWVRVRMQTNLMSIFC